MYNLPTTLSTAISAFSDIHKNKIKNWQVPNQGQVRFKPSSYCYIAYYKTRELIRTVWDFDLLPSYTNIVSVTLEKRYFICKLWIEWAKYISTNATIESFQCADMGCGEDTFLLIAASLCTNTSIKKLRMRDEYPIDNIKILTAFVMALRLNPARPNQSKWCINTYYNCFDELKEVAHNSTPPSMLEFFLCIDYDDENMKTAKH